MLRVKSRHCACLCRMHAHPLRRLALCCNRKAVRLRCPAATLDICGLRLRNIAANAADDALQETLKVFPYDSGDGHTQKATIEHVFSVPNWDQGTPNDDSPRQGPWAFGWQMNERNLVWNDELKLRLIKKIAMDELGINEEEMEERLQQLGNLLPDLIERLVRAPPKMVARLAGNTHLLVARMLRLRDILPQANVSKLTSGRLSLLLDEDLDDVEAAVKRLRQLLPSINVDRFVEAFPTVLHIQSFEMAVEDARRLLPGINIEKQLRDDPDSVLGFMKGQSLIPYDQIANPWS